MNRLSNMFKSKKRKESENQEKLKDQENMRIIRENRQHAKASQAQADIRTLEKSGYAPEKINKYRNPEEWDNLNNLAVMLRKSKKDKEAFKKEKETETLFKNIQKQNIESKQKLNISRDYLKSLGGTNTYIPTHWKDNDIIFQANATFRLRKLKDILDDRDTQYQLHMLPSVPTHVAGTRKGDKYRQNKRKTRKAKKSKRVKRRKNKHTRK